MQGPAHMSGHAGISGKKGRLSVADDLPGRNGADDVVGFFKEIHGGRGKNGVRRFCGNGTP